MSRVLVVGGEGQIGRALRARLTAEGVAVVATTRRREGASQGRVLLDLAADLRDWRPPTGIALAYLCAAVTSLEQCRQDPAGTRRVNVEALGSIGEKLLAAGAFVVFPSTNLVFDGSVPRPAPSDPVCPTTEYGRQKADLERVLLASGRAAVVRLTKVLSPQTRPLGEWREGLAEGKAIHPFADMVMAPVSLSFAAEVLLRVGRAEVAGITQVSAPQDITYEQAARQLARHFGVSPELVQPITTAQSGRTFEAVPRHTTLDTARLRDELGLQPPGAAEVLAGVFAQMAFSPPGEAAPVPPEVRPPTSASSPPS